MMKIASAFNDNEWDLVIESPGRINLIGEHIDYNDGYVLPTAIDMKAKFKLKKNGSDRTCRVFSKNFDTQLIFELDNVKSSQKQWENYILGVVHEIIKMASGLQGFDCEIVSDIPIGSGVSSSAALECGLAYGLNKLFDLHLDRMDIVKLSQRAEHNFVGTKCGIMDQFASVMSKKNNLILLDCLSLSFDYIPIRLKSYKLLLLNTNVTHQLASGEYNIRRQQCEEGMRHIKKFYPSISSFREVTPQILKELKPHLSEQVFKRSLFVVQEIERVLKAVEALKSDALDKLGAYMYETHEGLTSLYEVSCPELDFLVDFSKNNNLVLGSRMMGGGFGGCTLNLIHEDGIEEFISEISEAYLNMFQKPLTSFIAMPSNGTSQI